ncbi:hypothetical protein BS47DRAFT_1450710 [Hydnum rufescens UP504]|uniref:COP9 signalosome complex subunit 6 n=1 Tax=Hydnum rufescens UP504 TaxID=1448309 RepID=A0A9P6AZR5_9AGAM|nr:hypothetical protein BS47DRAFT_1450710 [Hydnum rufescens UP504]
MPHFIMFRHPLPILNVSEHLTRLKLQTRSHSPFIIGALLGTQNGRDVEIVNSFDLVTNAGPGKDLGLGEAVGIEVDPAFLNDRKEQYKLVFPSLDLIGWYTVAERPTPAHVLLHEQFTAYTPTPLLLILSPRPDVPGNLPLTVYEPIVEIKDRQARTVFIQVPEKIETGEAERIAVDWTARGGEGRWSLSSHLQTQRMAIKMLQDRIHILVKYVAAVIAGSATKDYDTLRSLTALVASLPASENPAFREEFNTEYSDVQLTAFLATLTKSAVTLNDIVNNHLLLFSPDSRDGSGRMGRKNPNKMMGSTRHHRGGVDEGYAPFQSFQTY